MWARAEPGGDVRVGFTHVPCAFLGDILHMEFPAPGTDVAAGEPIGIVESSSAVCEVLAPLAGIVVEVNPALESAPDRITDDPYESGWLLSIRPVDPSGMEGLLDAAEYGRFAGS